MSETNQPLIFISYAHEDNQGDMPSKRWLDRLSQHLEPLILQKHIVVWSDPALESGDEWESQIRTRLEQATAAVLLVSKAFLASRYIRNSELPVLLMNAKDRGTVIIPIIISPCLFRETYFKYPDPSQGPHQLSLSALQSANSPEDPLNALTEPEQDLVFLAVAQRLLKLTSSTLSNRQELSAPPQKSVSSTAMIGNLPRRNLFFTGREEICQELKVALSSEQTVVLKGLGGIGKTDTAAEYVYQHGYAYERVFWVSAESRDTLISDLSAIALQLKLPSAVGRDQLEIVRGVLHWLDTHRNWLLVFDNADDLAVTTEFLPRSRNGHVLVTSRAHATGFLGPCIQLKTLSPEQGARLLLRRAQRLKSNANLDAIPESVRRDALQIAEILEGLPLALDQAGAFLEETGSSPAEYLRLYQTERMRLLDQRGGDLPQHPSVFVTFSLACTRTISCHPAAEALFRLSAFLAPEAIPEDLFTGGIVSLEEPLSRVVGQPLEFANLFKEVGRWSLIHRDPQQRSFSLHRLVQAVIQDMMDKETQRVWAEKVVLLVNECLPHLTVDSWPRYEQLIPHALACATAIERWEIATEKAAHLLNQAGVYLSKRARYIEAKPLYQRALAIREQVLGPEHPDTAASLNDLASLYGSQGRYAEAEPLYQRALAIREQVLGPEHPDTAASLNNLASLYRSQGRYAEAEPLYQRALAIREQVLGPEHPDTAASLNDLASLYGSQGRYAEAEPLYQRALAIREQVLGPEHPDTATSLNGLAGLYESQGRYVEAEPLYQRTLFISERVLGPEHPDTAASLNNLASLYRSQGRYAEAEPLYQRALAIWERVLGPEHPHTAASLNNLASLYESQGRYAEAESLHRRALAICEQVLGPEHPHTAISLSNLAGLYNYQGRHAEAKSLYLRTLAIQLRVFGLEHPRTISLLQKLLGFKVDRKKRGHEGGT
ncbi:tetratricopeptide repeat protein [Nitrospira sp. NS4]|uniref:tetratricopeptide repeat protein n=1 Tax=Nitrospira sp. NS4 TaxID=3414498 RepID=UPI003C2CE1D0